jgi:hypothetical protein
MSRKAEKPLDDVSLFFFAPLVPERKEVVEDGKGEQ